MLPSLFGLDNLFLSAHSLDGTLFNPVPSYQCLEDIEVDCKYVGVQGIYFSYGDLKRQVLYTNSIMDCIAVVLFNLHCNLMVMYHHLWEKYEGKIPCAKKQRFPIMSKLLEELDRNLTSTYKQETQVTLVTYYLSDNLLDIASFLKDQGFNINSIYFHMVAMDDQNTIFLDPSHVTLVSPRGSPRGERQFLCLVDSDGDPLTSRSVLLDYKGNIFVDFKQTKFT